MIFQIDLQERLFTHFVAKTFPQNWRLKGFYSDKDCLVRNPKNPVLLSTTEERLQKKEGNKDSLANQGVGKHAELFSDPQSIF